MGSSHPAAINNQEYFGKSEKSLRDAHKSKMEEKTPESSKMKREADEQPAAAAPRSKAQRKNPPKYNSGARVEESRMSIIGRPINSLNTKSSRSSVAKLSSASQQKDPYLEVATNHMGGHNLGYSVTEAPGVYMPNSATPEFITIEPGLPTGHSNVYRDVEDEYHDVLMGLLQAIHNQNQIMEECRNILKSIHNVMTSNPQSAEPVPNLAPSQDVDLVPSYGPNNNNNIYPTPMADEAPKSNQETTPLVAQTGPPLHPPTTAPAPVNPTSEQNSSRDPDKPQVYGTDGEFSCTYLRHIFGKSSTATSFANVLMKEIFTLEERISSNCNGVMGKKALDSVRLEKIKRAVKRFYADTEADFQDLWKKCRKSIDSTNRNLKFIIMKRPNYIDS